MGHARTVRQRSLILAIAYAAIALVAPAVVSAAPGESNLPIRNPDLVASCGIDILVVLDESGSIDSAHAADDVEDAFRALLDGLKNTGSRVGVVEFDTEARLPLPGAARDRYTTVTDSTIDSIFEPYIENDYDPDGSTHWEDAFRAARYFLPRPDPGIPHLVLFITDGDPNRIVRNDRVTYRPGSTNPALNEYELKIPLNENETTGADENPAKDRAVSNANALKAQGSHILSVAVGDGLDSSSSLNRIIAVSGPDVFDGSGTFDIETDDVYREEDFDELESAMRDAAFLLCAPSVNVQKLLDIDPGPGADLQAGQGWSMDATVTPPPSGWVAPSGASGSTATGVTGPDGFVSFQWTTASTGSSGITVTEEVEDGYVNDPSATTCTYRTPDTPVDQPLPGFSATNGGFSGDVPFQSIVTCRMVNRVPPAPDVEIQKFTNGVDADLAPGPTIAEGSDVSWTYVVTNTGNVPLTDIAVDDSEGVTVTCDATTIAAGASMDCEGTGTATAGQYENTGTVTATGPGPSGPQQVTDDDPSHYFGSAPGIDIEKETNGADADSAPGPLIVTGGTVTWTYTITNTGNQELTGAAVTDDVEGAITCPPEIDPLAPGEVVICTETAPAVAGQYENVAEVTATDPDGDEVTDSDGSHYFGVNPGIDVEKFTNGQNADLAPGPLIDVGRPVAWTYQITNTGNVPLTFTLTDDQLGDVIACPRPVLLPGRTVFCFGPFGATAQPGQYANLATVVGRTPFGGIEVTDTDPSHYFGVAAGIDIEKFTNGVNADLPPGPYVAPGAPITWTYRVENTGNTELTGVVVEDLNGVAVTCPLAIEPLAVDEIVDCTGTGTAAPDQYTNHSTVHAQTATGKVVSDDDPSHYFGSVPGIDIQKSTNGDDADEAPGPFIRVGDPVDWTYTITNSGNVALTGVVVTDDQGVTVTCPPEIEPLAIDEIVTCTASGTAAEGQYDNVGSVTGTGPAGQTPTDEDPSHYFGAVSDIDIEKATNGQDADAAPGVLVPVGGSLTWTYVVTNPGNVAIKNVVITDDQGVVPTFVGGDTDADGDLDPGETWTYEATGTATAGQYTNVATVDGLDVLEEPVTDTDPSNYFGFASAIDLEKTPDNATVELGAPHTFTINVTNTGTSALTEVAVTDPVTPSCDRAIGDLAVDAVVTYTCDVASVTDVIVNTASVAGTDPVGGTVADSDVAQVAPIQPGRLGDLVWHDDDRDGVQDASEEGIEGARVDITNIESGASLTATTDGTGHYLVDLSPGDYRVALDMDSVESVLTTPGVYTITIVAGQTRLDADFGVADDPEPPDTATAVIRAMERALAPVGGLPAAVVAIVLAAVGSISFLVFRRRLGKPD